MPLRRYARAQAATAEFGVVPSYGEITRHATPEDLVAFEELTKASVHNRLFASHTLLDLDVAHLMADVVTPTMVIRSRDSVLTDQEQTRRLVTGITGAQLRIVPGTAAPWLADLDSVVEAFVSFLTSDHHHPSIRPDDEMRTVVFTDLVSSTEVLSRLGDEEGRSEFREVEEIVSDLCAEHHGQLIKNLGDGALISFKSTQRALSFALDLQGRMEASPFGMRIGMAAGEPTQEDDDLHGAVVVQASRIADLGQSSETLVADSVRQLAIGKAFSFEPRGEVQLKGFDEHTTVWKVTQSART
jgi:class 3 adenylate cyclase